MTALPSARYCKYLTAHAVEFSWFDEKDEKVERLFVWSGGPIYKSRAEAEFVVERFTEWVRFRVAAGAELSTQVVESFIGYAHRDRISWRWSHSMA